MLMVAIKLLKKVKKYNLTGYSNHEFLYGEEGEVVEVKKDYVDRLIKFGLGILIDEKPKALEPEGTGDEGSGDEGGEGDEGKGEDELFELSADSIKYLRGMTKDDIEKFLRKYDVEVDKRKSLEAIRDLMVRTIQTSLPTGMEASKKIVEDLIEFYADNLKIDLSGLDYENSNPGKMTTDVAAILIQALEDENS